MRQLRALTAPDALLGAVPETAGAACGLRRVVLSTVDGGAAQVAASWFEAGSEPAAAVLRSMAAAPLRLTSRLVESDVVRRSRGTLVGRPHGGTRTPALGSALGWDEHVIVPLVVRGQVIALVHADRGGEPLGQLERDALSWFASGAAAAYEIAHLRRVLRREREELRGLADWLGGRADTLAVAAGTLDVGGIAPATRPAVAPPGSVDTVVFEGLLTRRELEVLRLLTQGLGNRAIAEELVISQGTVKFHVNRILTRLRAANRSEAIARYYALMDGPRAG